MRLGLGFGLGFGLAFGVTVLVAGLSAHALARSGGLPCDAFVKNEDGSWSATRNVAVPGPGRVFNVREGALFRRGMSFMGMTLAEDLEKACPAAVETAAAAATQASRGSAPPDGRTQPNDDDARRIQ